MTPTPEQATAILPMLQRAAKAQAALMGALNEIESELGASFSDMTTNAEYLPEGDEWREMTEDDAVEWVEQLREDR